MTSEKCPAFKLKYRRGFLRVCAGGIKFRKAILFNLFFIPVFILASAGAGACMGAKKPGNPSATLKNTISVSKAPQGITINAENVNIYDLLNEISKVSGVTINVLDPAKAKAKAEKTVTFSIVNVSVEKGVKKLLESISAGGASYISRSSPTAPVSSISIALTREGTDAMLESLKKLRQKIINGEKPPAADIYNLLTQLYKTTDKKDWTDLDLYLLPVYHLILTNFSKYREIVYSIVPDRTQPGGLRYAMLEILDTKWEGQRAEAAVFTIFNRPDEEPPYLLGDSAEILSKHKVDISNEILKRFSEAPEMAKFFYATALAHLDAKKAVPTLRSVASDSNADVPFSVRISCLRALARIDIKSRKTVDIMMTAVRKSGSRDNLKNLADAKKKVESESLAMQTVDLLSKSSDPDVYKKILDIAGDEKLTLDTRISAVEALGKIKAVAADKRAEDLSKLKKTISDSKSLDDTQKKLIFIMIDSTIKQ